MKDLFSVNIAIERALMTLIVSLFMKQLNTIVEVEFTNLGYSRIAECIVKNPTGTYRIRFQVVINGKTINLPKLRDNRLNDFENKYILERIGLYRKGQQYLKISVDTSPFPLYFTCVVTMNQKVYLGNGSLSATAFPTVNYKQINETTYQCYISALFITFVFCKIGGSYTVLGSSNIPSFFSSGETYIYKNIFYTDPFITYAYVYLNYSIYCYCDSKLNIAPYQFNTSVHFTLALKDPQILILKPEIPQLRKEILCLFGYNFTVTINWDCGFCVNPKNDSYEKHVCDNTEIFDNRIKFKLQFHDTFVFNCTCSAIIRNFYPQYSSRIMPVPSSNFVVSYNNLPSKWRTRFTIIMIMWWLTLDILFFAITIYQFHRYFFRKSFYEIFVLFGIYRNKKISIENTYKRYALPGDIEFFNMLFVRYKLDVNKVKETQKHKPKEKPNPFANKNKEILTKTQSGKVEFNEKAYSLFRSKKSRMSEGLHSQDELENELVEQMNLVKSLNAENEPVYKSIFSKVNLKRIFSSRMTKDDIESVKDKKLSFSSGRLSTASSQEKIMVYRDVNTRISIRPGKYDLSTSELKESTRSQSIMSRRRTQTPSSVRDLLITFSKPVSSLRKKIKRMTESRISRLQKESKFFGSPSSFMNFMNK